MARKIIMSFLVMCLTVLAAPVMSLGTAHANGQEQAVWDGSVDITWFTEQPWGTDEEPDDYYISTPAQLAGLAFIVNGRLDTEKFPIKYKAGTAGKTDEDVDIEATVAAVKDGAEDDGTTVSGLTAEDLWNNEMTHVGASGGGSGVTGYDLYIGNQLYDFAGKTIHITEDLDLGGYSTGDSAAGPNWMPIGGRFPADIKTRKVIVDANFNGSIEGEFHTISNIYCNRHSPGAYMLSQGVGLIGSLGDPYDDPDYIYGHSNDKETVKKAEVFDNEWVSSVRNLCLGSSRDTDGYKGKIYANRMVGGFVGRAKDAVIENCANYATVSSTDHKGMAGILGACGGGGASEGAGTIRNCYNAGRIYSSSDGCPTGGIAGSNSFNIYNCYNVGQIEVPNAKTLSEGIGSHYGGTYVVDNCYSKNGSFSDTGREGSTTKNGYYYGTAADLVINTYVRNDHNNGGQDEGNGLKDPGFLGEINGNAGDIFVAAPSGVNNGYPVLFWQADGFDPGAKATVTIAGGSDKGTIEASLAKGGYLKKTKLAAGQSAEVPVGTTAVLTPNAEAPNVLDHYTASVSEGAAAKLRADYYTVTGSSSVTIDSVFKTLMSGTIHITGSAEHEIGLSKTGTALDKNGKAWSVKDYVVSDGDTVFQEDVLSAKAVLNKGAVCKDKDKEYTGKFEYHFVYSGDGASEDVRNASGVHKVTSDVGTESAPGEMTVSAVPGKQDKVWGTYADTRWAGDTSDVRGTYEISTPQQLAGLAKLVNEGESFAKATIKLGKNISLANPDGDGSVRRWEIIGRTSGTAFKGKFEGQGHTISGLTVRSEYSVGGLFGYCSGAEISDLTVSGNVSAKGNAAGVVSFLSGGKVSGCVSRVKVTSNGNRAGGITAQMSSEAVLENCVNRGSITGQSNAGGIAGEALDTAKEIKRCANYCDVDASGGSGIAPCTGGLVGYLGTKVDKSANFGNVTSNNKCVGGIAGFAYANTKASTPTVTYKSSSTITNSFNTGAVKGLATAEQTFVGGLVGRSDYLIMKNCYQTGSVNSAASKKTYLGTVVGGFYKSIYSNVSMTYYSISGSPTTSYTKNGSIINKDTVDPSLSYFKTQKMTLAEMKESSFVKTLNASSAGTFVSVPAGTPQLVWIAAKKDMTVTFTGAYEGTDKTYYGGSVDLPECPDEGYKYAFTAGVNDWDGTDIRADVTVVVKREKIQKSYVVFLADDEPVDANQDGRIDEKDRMYYRCEDGSGVAYTCLSAANITNDGITEIPDAELVAGKEGYTAQWDLYDKDGKSYRDASRTTALGAKSIRINAVYHQKKLDFVKDDDGAGSIKFTATLDDDDDGYYFLRPQAKGTITVKSGAEVTLDGSNGPFTNICIVAERGSRLVLKDLDISTDPVRLAGDDQSAAVLEIEGGTNEANPTVLKFSGHNNISGTNNGSYGSENLFPAIAVSGFVKFDKAEKESDVLHVTAAKDSPNINIKNGAVLDIAGGIVEVYRQERLGRNGGMIYGTSFDYKTQRITGDQKGSLKVSGGSLIAVSDTNNVFAACVDSYTQTGGHAIFCATEANMLRKGETGYIGTDVAVYADTMNVTGGSLSAKVRTHKNAASDPIRYYNNADAIECGDASGSGAAFSDKYFLYAIDTSEWDKGEHTVAVDGAVYYKGKGNTVSHPMNTSDSVRDKFSEKRANADPLICLWLEKGSAHQVKLDGEVIGDNVTEADMEHVKYMWSRSDDELVITFLDQAFAKTVAKDVRAGVAMYGADGKVTGYKSSKSFALTDEKAQVTLSSDKLKNAAKAKLFIYDGEKALRPLAESQELF